MDQIVQWNLFDLKVHPRNTAVFGDPRLVPEYQEIKESIRTNGIQEPIIIKRDGTILSGHLRYHASREIAAEEGKQLHEVTVPVRVHEEFENFGEELEYLFKANTQRRQLSPRQVSAAYTAMLEATEEPESPAGNQPGRPRKTDGLPPPLQRRQAIRERIAKLLRVSFRTADKIALVYQTPGVPAGLLEKVDGREISVALAASAVRFAINEALHRDPDATAVVVNPVDVHSYLANPPRGKRSRVSDLLRGLPPTPEEPVTFEGKEVTHYHRPIYISVPPPYRPHQVVRDMLIKGVEWSQYDYDDRGLPLHEAITRARTRLSDAFENSALIHEEKVESALLALLDKSAQYLRAIRQKPLTVRISDGAAQPTSLHERLLFLRDALDENDPNLDQQTHRRLLTEIAEKAKAKAFAKPPVEKKPKPKARAKAVPKTVFNTDLEFIVHVLGEDTLNALAP